MTFKTEFNHSALRALYVTSNPLIVEALEQGVEAKLFFVKPTAHGGAMLI